MNKDILSFLPVVTLLIAALFVFLSYDTPADDVSSVPIYAGFVALMLMPISGLLIYFGIGKKKHRLMFRINQAILLGGCLLSIYLWRSLK